MQYSFIFSFNINEATQMVLALVRALSRNVSMETLMHTYLIRSPVEKERFRVEAEVSFLKCRMLKYFVKLVYM